MIYTAIYGASFSPCAGKDNVEPSLRILSKGMRQLTSSKPQQAEEVRLLYSIYSDYKSSLNSIADIENIPDRKDWVSRILALHENRDSSNFSRLFSIRKQLVSLCGTEAVNKTDKFIPRKKNLTSSDFHRYVGDADSYPKRIE